MRKHYAEEGESYVDNYDCSQSVYSESEYTGGLHFPFRLEVYAPETAILSNHGLMFFYRMSSAIDCFIRVLNAHGGIVDSNSRICSDR